MEWLMLYVNGAAAQRRIRDRPRTRLTWADGPAHGFEIASDHLTVDRPASVDGVLHK